MKPAPKNWGKDPLTEYLDTYRENQFATFANKEDPVSDVIRIDKLFLDLLHGAINPRPFIPMTFMLRAHAAFRAAAGAVMAGQLYEAQALLRLCLEHGAYGFYIGADTKRWERWMRRTDSEAAKQIVRSEFKHNKVKMYIKSHSPKMADQFEKLYEQMIDFGAHPNEQGFSMNSSIRKVGGDVHFDTIYLQRDGVPLDLGLKMTGRVGLWVLHLMQLIYTDRYELLGIRVAMEEIRRRF